MNNASLIGRLTKDPERFNSGKGKDAIAITKFTVAVDNPYKKDDADFIRITTFGTTAEFAEKHLSKGTRIGLIGRIQTGSYENEDGNTVYTTEVVANNLFFADAPKESDNKPEHKSASKGYKSSGKK